MINQILPGLFLEMELEVIFPVCLVLFNFTEFSKKHTYNFYS